MTLSITPTGIERNPPLGGNGGWGDPTDTVRHRIYKERIEAEDNEDAGVYSAIPELVLARGDESPMEKLIRSQMKYDDGWDLDFVDRLLYGTAAVLDQNGVGSCVGAGASSAVASKIASELLLEGDAENPFGVSIQQYKSSIESACPCVDYAYGGGKMKRYWNGEKFTRESSLGDGSYCSAQIWAMKTIGVLPCRFVENADKYVFPQTRSIRRHAGNRDQFLNRHLEVGQKFRMLDSTRVRSADDLKEVICNLKQPCMICSGWAFKPDRKVEGLGYVYRASGSWAHNMSLVACVQWKSDWYVKVRNQWGSNAHKDGWFFWIPLELFDRWVRDAECQAIGELELIPSDSSPEFPF